MAMGCDTVPAPTPTVHLKLRKSHSLFKCHNTLEASFVVKGTQRCHLRKNKHLPTDRSSCAGRTPCAIVYFERSAWRAAVTTQLLEQWALRSRGYSSTDL